MQIAELKCSCSAPQDDLYIRSVSFLYAFFTRLCIGNFPILVAVPPVIHIGVVVVCEGYLSVC